MDWIPMVTGISSPLCRCRFDAVESVLNLSNRSFLR